MSDAGEPRMENEGDSDPADSINERRQKRTFVPALALAGFAVSIPGLILTLLAVDIASTFQVPVGFAAQLSTTNGAAGVVFALLMGGLAVRFKHKSLLLVGVGLVAAGSLIAFAAPSLAVMQLVYVLAGGGAVIVNIMSLTLVGEFLPSNKKAKVVSYLFAVISLAYVVGTPLIGLLTNFGGWRIVFVFLVLPTTAAGLALSLLTLPSGKAQTQLPVVETSLLKSFRQVFSNRSAASCLVGGIIGAAGTATFGIFAIAFYREHFLMPRDFGVEVTFVISALFVVSALVMGRLVNRFGGKNMTVVSYLLTGIFTIAFFFGPNLWVCLALNLAHAWFFAAGGTAYRCLVLDQVPQSRATMLSMSDVFGNVGVAIGAAVGGGLLVLLSYQVVGLAFGTLCLAATAIYFFLTRDSCKIQPAITKKKSLRNRG